MKKLTLSKHKYAIITKNSLHICVFLQTKNLANPHKTRYHIVTVTIPAKSILPLGGKLWFWKN